MKEFLLQSKHDLEYVVNLFDLRREDVRDITIFPTIICVMNNKTIVQVSKEIIDRYIKSVEELWD